MSPNASRASDTYGLLEMKRFVFFLVRLSSSSTSQFENCLTGIPSSVGLACSTASCQLKNQVARSPITETASLCARCGKMYLGTQPPRAIARLMASCVTHYGEPRAEPRPVAPYSVLFLSQPPSHPIVTHPHAPQAGLTASGPQRPDRASILVPIQCFFSRHVSSSHLASVLLP
jgi:hypothetical protein